MIGFHFPHKLFPYCFLLKNYYIYVLYTIQSDMGE